MSETYFVYVVFNDIYAPTTKNEQPFHSIF